VHYFGREDWFGQQSTARDSVQAHENYKEWDLNDSKDDVDDLHHDNNDSDEEIEEARHMSDID